jgi:hypothetical protein
MTGEIDMHARTRGRRRATAVGRCCEGCWGQLGRGEREGHWLRYAEQLCAITALQPPCVLVDKVDAILVVCCKDDIPQGQTLWIATQEMLLAKMRLQIRVLPEKLHVLPALHPTMCPCPPCTPQATTPRSALYPAPSSNGTLLAVGGRVADALTQVARIVFSRKVRDQMCLIWGLWKTMLVR